MPTAESYQRRFWNVLKWIMGIVNYIGNQEYRFYAKLDIYQKKKIKFNIIDPR